MMIMTNNVGQAQRHQPGDDDDDDEDDDDDGDDDGDDDKQCWSGRKAPTW